MLTEHDATVGNLELGSEFERYLFEHPEMLGTIPQDAHVVLLPLYDRDLYNYNLALGRRRTSEGAQVVYVKVGGLADTPPPSRLREVSIEPAA